MSLQNEQKLFAIKAPSGALLWNTAASTRTRAWALAYHRHLHLCYGQYENASKAAYKAGWRCVPVEIKEIKPTATTQPR